MIDDRAIQGEIEAIKILIEIEGQYYLNLEEGVCKNSEGVKI